MIVISPTVLIKKIDNHLKNYVTKDIKIEKKTYEI